MAIGDLNVREGGVVKEMDLMLLNGKPRATLIQRFDRSVVVIAPMAKEVLRFRSLREAEEEVEKRGWVISVVHPTLKSEEV